MRNIKHILMLLLFVIINNIFFNAYGQEYEITLITISSGEDIYSIFGHTALRIENNTTKFDQVYDFGTFNPKQENFIYNFIKGTASYSGEVHNGSNFLNYYFLTGRKITLQKLRFSDQIIKEIKDTLDILINGEYKYYYYNFTRNNCTTKIRDILLKYINKNFDYKINSNFLKEIYHVKGQHGFINSLLFDGIALAVGIKGYKNITAKEKMFLPENLSTVIDSLKINNEDLNQNTQIINNSDEINRNFIKIINLSIILLILFYILRIPSNIKLITSILVIIILVLLFFVIISTRELMTYNLNLIWLSSFILFVIFREKSNIIFYLLLIILIPFFVLFIYQSIISLALIILLLIIAAMKSISLF